MNILSIFIQALVFLILYPIFGIFTRDSNGIIIAILFALIIELLKPTIINFLLDLCIQSVGYSSQSKILVSAILYAGTLYAFQLFLPNLILVSNLPGALLAGLVSGLVDHILLRI